MTNQLRGMIDTKSRGLSSYIVQEEPAISPGKGEDVDNIVKDYVAGYPIKYLQQKYSMSAGQVFSHIKARRVPLRLTNRSKMLLGKRMAHLTEKDIKGIIKDYTDGVPNVTIYDKYDIHKNGLYNILDMNNIERKRLGGK